MNIKIGDTVAFSRDKASVSDHAVLCWGVDYINHFRFKRCKFYKGEVTKIKTHFLFFFKLKNPIYLIDDYYVVKNVKLVIKKHAEIVEPCKNPECYTLCQECALF